MKSRRLLPPLAVLVLALAVSPGRAGAEPTRDPKVFIQHFGNRAIEILTVNGLTDQELADRFRSLFIEGFDVPAIARRVLGRYWPRASGAERNEYLSLFEDYVVHIYASRFRQYSGETFKAQDMRRGSAEYIVVASELVSPDPAAPPIRVDWLVANSGKDYKIQDVIIEGVSMVVTQRSEFASVIRQRGGKVAGLIDALRQKTADLRASR